jgi:Cu2+-exporting ATPase
MANNNKSNQQHNHSQKNSADSKANQNNHDHGHEHHDHTDHHRMMIKDFKLRFWISLIFTLPILVLSPMVQDLPHLLRGFL